MSLQKKLEETSKVIGKMETEAHAGLLRAYKKALNDLKAELANIYVQYEVDGVLTYSEMSKYGRLRSLFDTVASQVKDMTGETSQITHDLSGNVYQMSYYRTAFALETSSKVRLGFGLLDPAVIKAAVENKLKGIDLSGRLAKNRAEVLAKLRDQITQGMIRGESYAQVANRLKDVLESDAAKALRIASTEVHHNYMQGFVDADNQAGENGLQTEKDWVATLDGHTRQSHRDMDGVAADADGNFTLVSGDNKGATAEAPGLFGIAEEDIDCRCRPIIVIKGYEPKLRRAREDGQSTVIDYQTYGQWYEDTIAA